MKNYTCLDFATSIKLVEKLMKQADYLYTIVPDEDNNNYCKIRIDNLDGTFLGYYYEKEN